MDTAQFQVNIIYVPTILHKKQNVAIAMLHDSAATARCVHL